MLFDLKITAAAMLTLLLLLPGLVSTTPPSTLLSPPPATTPPTPLSPPPGPVASRAVTAVLAAMNQSNWFHYRNFASWSYEAGT